MYGINMLGNQLEAALEGALISLQCAFTHGPPHRVAVEQDAPIFIHPSLQRHCVPFLGVYTRPRPIDAKLFGGKNGTKKTSRDCEEAEGAEG